MVKVATRNMNTIARRNRCARRVAWTSQSKIWDPWRRQEYQIRCSKEARSKIWGPWRCQEHQIRCSKETMFSRHLQRPLPSSATSGEALDKTLAVAVRDMLLQDDPIVTVYNPKVEKENAFSESRDHDIQVDRGNSFSPAVRRKQLKSSCVYCVHHVG